MNHLARILATITFATAALAMPVLAMPVLASAQPSTDQAAPPSYARPTYSSDEETVRGRIVSFDGGYNLQIRDDRGFIDNVALKNGTIINPTGIRLVPGMSVTIYGVNRGSVLAANQIDTPYQTYGAVPYYYPAYPYPYAYGPVYSIGIGIGPGWYGHHWH